MHKALLNSIRKKNKGWLLLGLATATLLVLLLAPATVIKVPSFLIFNHSDKFIHFGLFFAAGFTTVLGTGFLKSYRKQLLAGAGFCLFMAVATELGQSMIPSRSMDYYDLLADFVGASAALLLLLIIYRIYYRYLRPGTGPEQPVTADSQIEG